MTPGPAFAQTDCFRSVDNVTKFDVFQISAPPTYSSKERRFAANSPAYPATDYATSMSKLKEPVPDGVGAQAFRRHYLLWANRCVFIEGRTSGSEQCRNVTRAKGNSYPGMVGGPLVTQLRTVFSTYSKANACTLISAKRALGEAQAQIEEEGRAAGLVVYDSKVSKDELKKAARHVKLGMPGSDAVALVDICIVESEAMASDVSGVLLDYEVFDSRRPNEVTSFFRSLKDYLSSKGKTLVVNTNPLPREPNGIDATNVEDVLRIVDGFAPTISTGATIGNPAISLAPQERKIGPVENYKSQLDVLTDGGRRRLSNDLKKKIIWNISLYDTSLSEASFFHEEVMKEGYRGIMLFRNYTKLGGDCAKSSNQVIACLALGRCSGDFGYRR
jgi:hypothetical protein